MSSFTKYTALIIDDEEPARDLIKLFLNDFPRIEVLDESEDGFSGYKKILEHRPQLIFLDIQMPKLTGFEMLEMLKDKPEIIFTTAYDHFAVQAFEQNAADYLLKPFSKDRFGAALAKAIERIKSGKSDAQRIEKIVETTQNQEFVLDRVAVKRGRDLFILSADDVFCITADDDYVTIHSEKEKFLKEATMNYFERHLSADLFARIHRSAIVNMSKIEKIEQLGKETYSVVMKNREHLTASRSGYKLLKDKLNL
jgi:two-component system LytT family response regulator